MASSRVGLGLQTHSRASVPPEAALSTAPASPTDDMATHKSDVLGPEKPSGSSTTTTTTFNIPQHTTMGQMSFGPAIQKTITTVTTTTITDLPPLAIHPPRDLHERDPKQYPLAFSPTPSFIKQFSFDYHGRPTTFQESEDPQETLRAYNIVQDKIRQHNGAIRQDEQQHDYSTPIRSFKPPALVRSVYGVRSSSAAKRSAAPVSITEAAELASLQRKSKKQRSSLHRTQSEMSEFPSLDQRAASGEFRLPSGQSPITPITESGSMADQGFRAESSRADRRQRRGDMRLPHSRLHEAQDVDDDGADDLEADHQDGSALMGPPLGGLQSQRTKRSFTDDQTMEGTGMASGAVATPPIAENDMLPPVELIERRRPQNLPNILTGSQRDASLPSPSLSPITAAANAASRNRNAFDESFADHIGEHDGSMSALDLNEDKLHASTSSLESQRSIRPAVPSFASSHGIDSTSAGSAPPSQGPTLMDIPTMVDAFDSMPEAMQTYLLYQFLRRCTKSTLQSVATIVNPALKCDPFNVLPPELSLNITRFLDAQSMCQAAQVSKRWRKLINSDERAWRNLLERDDFVLPDGEIARAVKEGWGWQHPGEDGCEEDLGQYLTRQTSDAASASADLQSTVVSDDEDMTSSSTSARARRKTSLRHATSKKSKRRSVQIAAVPTKVPSTMAPWRRLLAAAQGPDGYAHAATTAVPHPSIGLPSLKNMHLFKSLYQRHYLIRKAWMTEKAQPQHLAFRAHHRHVVTCLLFDSDNILTGSDDTKINVYDTKTGALRNRLEGHEGGVWALQYEGDTLVSGSTDRSVRVWDIKTGRCLQVFHGHTSTVRCLVILQPVQIGTEDDGTPIMMPKEPLIITGSRDSTLRVWKLPGPNDRSIFQAGPPANDRDNPYFLRTLAGHHNSVRAIAAHGDMLISGSYDCTVRVWKISTGDLVHRLQGHTQKVYSVVLDHARNRCLSGSMDNLVKVWDLQTGSCLFNLEGHTSLVGLLDLSHDRLVSAAADGTLRIWDPESGVCKATLSAHTGAITCFQHDGQKVISGSDRTLKMWNVKNGECVRDLLTDLSGVWQVRFDERRCVAAVQRNNLTYIEVLDFGASRDGIPAEKRGRRIVVDPRGREIEDVVEVPAVADPDGAAAAAAGAAGGT